MKYDFNGKTVNIDDTEIARNMKILELSKEEVIQMYLEDNNLIVNEEQEELDTKAKKVKIKHSATNNTNTRKDRKPKTVKISLDKIDIFDSLVQFLEEKQETSNDFKYQIMKENKLIHIQKNGKLFKLDLIETRQKKAGK